MAALIAWGLSRWTSLPFFGAFALVAGSMFINGVIAEREDNVPGGFNDPLPPETMKKEPIQTTTANDRHAD